jgi:hypothetical protein
VPSWQTVAWVIVIVCLAGLFWEAVVRHRHRYLEVTRLSSIDDDGSAVTVAFFECRCGKRKTKRFRARARPTDVGWRRPT